MRPKADRTGIEGMMSADDPGPDGAPPTDPAALFSGATMQQIDWKLHNR